MSKYTVEKGIPLVPHRRQLRSAYPFADMEVGDSFLVEGVSENLRKRMTSAANYWRRFAQKSDWRFSAREVDGGVRVYRMK